MVGTQCLLLLSSVLRNAALMQTLSGGPSGDGAIKNAGFELECTLQVAKWIFGVMLGFRLKALADVTLRYKAELFDSLMSSPDLPSPSLLREVLRWADFYDFSFFPRLLAEILYEVATIGGCYALSALTIAIDLEDLRLAKYATKRLSCVPDPSDFCEKYRANNRVGCLVVYGYRATKSIRNTLDWVGRPMEVHCGPARFKMRALNVSSWSHKIALDR